MRILAIVNQKGGCGKTTTAVNLASRMATMGNRTVLVDLDPQGHSTLAYGVEPPERHGSLARVLSRSGLDPDVVPIQEILVGLGDRLSLAPSGAELASLDQDLAGVPGGEERLAEHLTPLIPDTDMVIIDAPPSLGLLTLNALMAAGEIIVPVEPSLYSLHGLARIVELTKLLEGRSRHKVRMRVLLNAFDARTRFARETRDEIARSFPGMTLTATIRSSVRVREAAARGMPLERFSPRSPIMLDYDALAEELEHDKPVVAEARDEVAVPGLRVTTEGVYISRKDVAPDAVCLAGDFNSWVPDSGVLLESHEDGSWTKFIPLKPGRYEYRLVVDGQWMPDPMNPSRVPNGIGSVNSVLEVED